MNHEIRIALEIWALAFVPGILIGVPLLTKMLRAIRGDEP